MLSRHAGRARSVGLKLAAILAVAWFAAAAQAATVTLAWDPNTEPDLAGYKLCYGTTAGSYTSVVDVGKVTTYTISSLADGTTYYFAVMAYSISGGNSGYSNQVTYTTPAGPPAGNGKPTPRRVRHRGGQRRLTFAPRRPIRTGTRSVPVQLGRRQRHLGRLPNPRLDGRRHLLRQGDGPGQPGRRVGRSTART